MQQEWFASWFDSPYYQTLYQHRTDAEAFAFIEHLIERLALNEKDLVLDLACGNGRHAEAFAKQGIQVTGVDLSPKSIDIAKKRALDNLHFDVHDMRLVYKADTFNYIFNLFTSFGYFKSFEENGQVVNAIATGLQADGKLLIDFMNAIKVEKNLVKSEQKMLDGIEFNISRKVADGFIVKDIQFSDKGKAFHFQERVQYLTLENFEQLLHDQFEIVSIWGDYRLNDFDANVSNRLIIYAEKR